MAEAFKILISKRKLDGLWKGVKVAEGVDNISHLQFANDTLLLDETSFKEIRVIKQVINKCNPI